ncbi:uncharacterized protein LOC144616464 [Panthera onca]
MGLLVNGYHSGRPYNHFSSSICTVRKPVSPMALLVTLKWTLMPSFEMKEDSQKLTLSQLLPGSWHKCSISSLTVLAMKSIEDCKAPSAPIPHLLILSFKINEINF